MVLVQQYRYLISQTAVRYFSRMWPKPRFPRDIDQNTCLVTTVAYIVVNYCSVYSLCNNRPWSDNVQGIQI